MDGSIRLMGFDSRPSPEKTGKVRLEMSGPLHRIGPEIIAGYDDEGRSVNLTVSLSESGDARSFDVFAHLLRQEMFKRPPEVQEDDAIAILAIAWRYSGLKIPD